MENLFVYGILKEGFKGHHLLKDCRFISTGQTFNCFCMYDMGEFPMVVEWDEVSSIKGEIYRVPSTNDFWEALDDFEGDEYRRIETPVIMDGSGTTRCQMYVAIEEPTAGMMIREGIWRNKT